MERTLGVSVEIVPYEPLGSDPRLLSRPATCWLHGWQADFPDPTGFLVPALMATSGPAAAHYRGADVLELLTRVEAAHDRDERIRLVQDLERVWLTEHVALVPLTYHGPVTLRRPWVEGFWSTPLLPGYVTDVVIRR